MHIDMSHQVGTLVEEWEQCQCLGLCFYYGGAGHLVTVCPNKDKAAHNINKDPVQSYSSLCILVELKICRSSVHALWDSGAMGNNIDKPLITHLPSSISLADGTVVSNHITEEVVVQIFIQDHEEMATFDVGYFLKSTYSGHAVVD